MPTTKTSKVKKAKTGKGKEGGKQEPKLDKGSDVEKAKASAALWELRQRATNQSLSEYQEACHKLARANEQLTNQLFRAEKDSVDAAGHWERQLAAQEDKIHTLEKTLKSQEALAREEKNKLMKNYMDATVKEHQQTLKEMEEDFLKEKARLQQEIMELHKKLAREKDLREAITQLEGSLLSSVKERDSFSEAVKHYMKEAEDLQKLAQSLTKENTLLTVDKGMLEDTIKKNTAEIEAQKEKLSKLRAQVASLKQALELKAEELEEQGKKEKLNMVNIQASQVELEKLVNVIAMQEKEMKNIKQLAGTIVEKRSKLEEFFHEALDEVKKEIVASRLQYKKEALQGYRLRFREATAGKIKFPPIRTFHKSPHSTNSVYSDMEAASTWTFPLGAEVQISSLTWEQKEQVLRLLFAKMNGQTER
ncbi:basal body-orientation factor 1-like [Pholidichthys leucotaenia]